MIKFICSIAIALSLTACASIQKAETQEPAFTAYGTLVSVRHYQAVQSDPNLGNAAVGSLAGGVIGHQFGKGDGKTAMTIIGAVVGAGIGAQVNEHQTQINMAELQVQMQDGHVFSINVPDTGFVQGQQVEIMQQGKKALIRAI